MSLFKHRVNITSLINSYLLTCIVQLFAYLLCIDILVSHFKDMITLQQSNQLSAVASYYPTQTTKV